MQTLTLAGIYAKQGYTDEAREIYRAILEREPENEEARRALEALAPSYRCSGNEEMLALFNSLADDIAIRKLERWLVAPWN